jgi:hypothetical protein
MLIKPCDRNKSTTILFVFEKTFSKKFEFFFFQINCLNNMNSKNSSDDELIDQATFLDSTHLQTRTGVKFHRQPIIVTLGRFSL